MRRLFPALAFALWLCVPLLPGVPAFWFTLADYAGIAAVVAIGLVVLTGYGGMTSFAQATFMGFGAYAAALLLSFGYNARKGDRLRTTQLRLGMVGPSAFGEQVQNRWHDVIGSDRFDGWDHQLRDEPVLQLIHERRKRLGRRETPGGWGWDLTRHWGGSLGNFATYANVGGEWRFGARLPDDFGTAPLRPAGENTSPVKEVADRRWHGHVFVAVDARWVLHDITLDGNTFKSSHSVDKRPMVADIGYGVALHRGHWRFALARYHRTREFDGQEDIPVYGTFTIGRHF